MIIITRNAIKMNGGVRSSRLRHYVLRCRKRQYVSQACSLFTRFAHFPDLIANILQNSVFTHYLCVSKCVNVWMNFTHRGCNPTHRRELSFILLLLELNRKRSVFMCDCLSQLNKIRVPNRHIKFTDWSRSVTAMNESKQYKKKLNNSWNLASWSIAQMKIDEPNEWDVIESNQSFEYGKENRSHNAKLNVFFLFFVSFALHHERHYAIFFISFVLAVLLCLASTQVQKGHIISE